MSENWQQFEIYIVIKQHLSCDGLLHYKCVIQFAGERIYKIREHLAKLQA